MTDLLWIATSCSSRTFSRSTPTRAFARHCGSTAEKNGGPKFKRWFDRMIDGVEARRADPEQTAALEHSVIASAKGWSAHGAVFSSDYPHPEGGRDPIKRFEASFDQAQVGAAARERFYSENFNAMMGVAGRGGARSNDAQRRKRH